jgi:NAD(P)-dependent dehydrogenase (short-subunit alcohol dehydrogenase family)
VARAFAVAGCREMLLLDSQPLAGQAREELLRDVEPPPKIDFMLADISREEDVERALAGPQRVDYLVNCAGVLGEAKPTHELGLEDFDRVNAVNYRGAWLVNRAALRIMVGQEPLAEHPGQRGAVVNVASQLGVVGRPTAGPSLPFPSLLCQRLSSMPDRLLTKTNKGLTVLPKRRSST